jgi:hypothetical protein
MLMVKALVLQRLHGLALAKEGVMIDASFAEVPKQRNSREDNALIKEGKVPQKLEDNAKIKAHKDLDGLSHEISVKMAGY